MNTQKLQAKATCSLGNTFLVLVIVIVVVLITMFIIQEGHWRNRGRSKVSRVKSDHRSLATGLEAYYVDNGAYPAMATGAKGANAQFHRGNQGAYRICTFRLRNYGDTLTKLKTLTTPIAYLTGYFSDPFASTMGSIFGYRQYEYTWLLFSYGPDRDEKTCGDHYNTVAEVKLTSGGIDLNFETAFDLNVAQPSMLYLGSLGVKGTALHYDPTNGTTSEGDIVRVKG